MPRTYLILGDIEGALDTLRVECTKCRRKGRYSVRKLIEKYGRKRACESSLRMRNFHRKYLIEECNAYDITHFDVKLLHRPAVQFKHGHDWHL